MRIRRLILLACTRAAALLAAMLAPCVLASGVITVNLPWVRMTSGTASAEVYMEIRSSEPATLIGARTDRAASVTFQSPDKRAATVDTVELPPRTTVMLGPDGYRLRLTRLTRPLKVGERVPMVLTIRGADGKQSDIPINAEVRRRSAVDDHLRPHKH